MYSRTRIRHGFTLVEVLVAVLFVGVALLALEGGAAALLRAVTDGGRELVAARLAQARAERVAGATCASGGGTDSVGGVVATWTAASAGGMTVITQTTRYATAGGVRSESYRTVAPCR